MSVDAASSADRAVQLEQRAGYLRVAILSDRKFMEGVQSGYDEMERGDVVPLADLIKEFDEGAD